MVVMPTPQTNDTIDALARRIFLAEHVCSRDIQQPDPREPVLEVHTWMELHDFDQAPLAGSQGRRVIMRAELEDQPPQAAVEAYARDTPDEHWIDARSSLHDTLTQLAERDWLLLREGAQLIGIVTRHDLASPVVSAYLLACLLGLERGLRRLYGSYSHQPLAEVPVSHSTGDAPIANIAAATAMTEVVSPVSTFSEVMRRVMKQQDLRAALGYGSGKAFKKATSHLINLRNDLAHGRSLLHQAQQPAQALAIVAGLEDLLDKVRDLIDDRHHIWDAFAATMIVEARNPDLVLSGPNAATLSMRLPVHVITAQNPREQVLSPSENERRHRLLHSYLKVKAPNATLLEVIGRSCQGDWKENSWAISGLERHEVLRIASRFQQRAIFELMHEEMLVIDNDGVVRRQVPRSR